MELIHESAHVIHLARSGVWKCASLDGCSYFKRINGLCRSPRFFVKIMMFFCFCKDCNDVIARVVTNLNLITACYSPQKEPHYDTVPEQEDSRPRFVFTHHHSHEVDVPFCLYHIKQL